MTLGPDRRLIALAVGRHLPRSTVRVRLTVLYGGLFLLSGAALMAIAYILLVNAGFVFTLQNGTSSGTTQPATTQASGSRTFPVRGSRTHPSAQTLSYWRGVAGCMRRHGVPRFPEPSTKVPTGLAGIGVISDRNGALLVFPASLDQQSATFTAAAATCGFAADSVAQLAQERHRTTATRDGLLVQSGIALAAMSLLSLGLGWLMAGRVLRPLDAAYEAQRQFVANASHELRAPLTRLRALIQVALADPEASFESLRAAHERVLASEQHLELMIDGLLDLTRGQVGIERREELDLAALTAEAIRARQPDLVESGLEVRTSLSQATTVGDARLLERLIANLLDNAIHHNVPGGDLEVTTGADDRHAVISVVNSGAHVPPEQVERLCRPFQRLEGRTRHDAGHGLGLSIVQAIAEAHGAALSINARPEGGLAVELSLPAATGQATPSKSTHAWVKRRDPRPSLRD